MFVFVSKNTKLLLIGLAAMIPCINSFSAQDKEKTEQNQGWLYNLYNRLPSKRTLGYYISSAGLTPIIPTIGGRYCILNSNDNITRARIKGALTPWILMLGGNLVQEAIDSYYEPTPTEQQKASFARALSFGALAGLAAYYLNNDIHPAIPALASTLAGLYGGLTQGGMYSTLEDRIERLEDHSYTDQMIDEYKQLTSSEPTEREKIIKKYEAKIAEREQYNASFEGLLTNYLSTYQKAGLEELQNEYNQLTSSDPVEREKIIKKYEAKITQREQYKTNDMQKIPEIKQQIKARDARHSNWKGFFNLQ